MMTLKNVPHTFKQLATKAVSLQRRVKGEVRLVSTHARASDFPTSRLNSI